MESEKFDALVRNVQDAASRRGVLRAGIGAVVLSVLTRFDQAEAKKHMSEAMRRHLAVAKKKHNHKKKKKKKPVQCTGSTPVTCGTGCCVAEFPTCCPDAFTHDSVCVPSGFQCCP